MRLDHLARLIETADFMSFRELAIECLSLRGYRDVTLTDGWGDGGTDLRVYQFPPNPTPVAFQISVERDWKSKLNNDALKVKNKLNIDSIFLITSRRVPEADFVAASENLFGKWGIHAFKIDSQSIASTFFHHAKTTRVLCLLGIDAQRSSIYKIETNARFDAAYSFVFFGQDTADFRNKVLEAAILSTVSRMGACANRDILLQNVCNVLEYSDTQKHLVLSSIDRMIQRGDLSGRSNTISLKSEIEDAVVAMHKLRESEWETLRKEIGTFLLEKSVRTSLKKSHLDAVMDQLGAMLLLHGRSASFSLSGDEETADIVDRLLERNRQLHTAIDTIAFTKEVNRDDLIKELVDIASSHPIGRALVAGELFLSISSTTTPYLIRALGARSGITIILDASVAIPVVCGVLYEPADNVYSETAKRIFKQADLHDFEIKIPLDYIEEAATHLLDAYRDYSTLVDQDDDLSMSSNAFVAHYVYMRKKSANLTFDIYLKSFGLDEKTRHDEYFNARDALIPRLQRLFDHYGIGTILFKKPTRSARKEAEENITYAMSEVGISRPNVVLEHDTKTIAYLIDQERTGEISYIFCTWDRLHFCARRKAGASWLVVNPATLSDILALADPINKEEKISNPVLLAKMFSESEVNLGARVLDKLVVIQREKGYDAQFNEKAKRFKEDYILRKQGGKTRSIEEEWAIWKGKEKQI